MKKLAPFAVALLAWLPGAGVHSGATAQEALPFSELPGWQSDRLAGWTVAWQRSCALSPWTHGTAQGLTETRKQAWQDACRSVLPAEGAVLRRWIEKNFTLHLVEGEGLVTGYFEPVIEARPAPDAVFSAPLYRPPPEVVQSGGNQPLWPREAIAAGALAGRGLEIAWADPVDLFFLQIQGSGVLALPGRPPLRVAFAGTNRHSYHPIGRDLIDRGVIARADMSMQAIERWLRSHPAEAAELMNRNPRYVFFRESKAAGPVGASGAVLTGGRSLAIDPAHFSYGLPVWLDLPDRTGRGDGGGLQRLTVSQDTGYAIKGPARADFFWGAGEAAGEKAGRMKARGRLYMLLPREGGSR
jgi:membrane-bound lytic murein transglycosylase A